jgi:hypothetical protein
MTRYGFEDFELDESTDAIPGKWILTICTLTNEGYADEEIATIVHRETSANPIEGSLAASKRDTARMIVAALNAYTEGE